MEEDDLPYCIETHHQVSLPGADDGEIRRVVRTILQAESCPGAEISVALLDEASVRDLNVRYAGQSEDTDVLAFDLTGEDDGASLVGQVVVNVEMARRRSAERDIDPVAELMLYVTHGCLHLLGHDDAQPEQAAAMHQREDELLERLGYGRVYAELTDPQGEGPCESH